MNIGDRMRRICQRMDELLGDLSDFPIPDFDMADEALDGKVVEVEHRSEEIRPDGTKITSCTITRIKRS